MAPDFFQHGDIQCEIQRGFFEFHFLQGIWETNEGSEISGTFLGAPKSGIRAEQDTLTQNDGGNTRWQVEATRITPTTCECEWTGLVFYACLTKCYIMFCMGSPCTSKATCKHSGMINDPGRKGPAFSSFLRQAWMALVRFFTVSGYHKWEISVYNRLEVYFFVFFGPSIKCWPSHLSHNFHRIHFWSGAQPIAIAMYGYGFGIG